MVKVIVGTQWGDEGKGRVIELLAKDADVVARYQGGANAGHTILINKKALIFHTLPSGIIFPNAICVIGNGVVIDPFGLIDEINALKEWNIEIKDRLFISDRAHIVMPYHKLKDDNSGVIGTTRKGIGPCYEDKYGRRGIVMADLLEPEIFKNKLKANIQEYPAIDFYDIYEKYQKAGKILANYVADTSFLMNKWIDEGKNVVLEGAQGLLLDVDHGTYPFVTSSNPQAGAACSGLGISPTKIDEVIGITKAYTSRVGNGPFPTEILSPVAEQIRQKGKEFGATTGRPRRCGWFDAVLVKRALMINGIKKIVLTKLDVLDELPEIKICIDYKHLSSAEVYPRHSGGTSRYGGGKFLNLSMLSNVEPIYETSQGWQTPINNIQKYNDLPDATKKYIERLAELLDVEIPIICVGPDKEETIYR